MRDEIAKWAKVIETAGIKVELTMGERLKGKVALVAGAGCVGPGWGNGRATSVIFAQEGARVFAVDRDAASMTETVARAREGGGEITTHLCDVTDPEEVAAMVEACVAAYGRIDVLVNNVGGSASGGPVELSLEGWDHQLDYNLTTVFLACKYTLPVMVRQNGGAIVNTSSTSGLAVRTARHRSAMPRARPAVIQFSRVLAVQYAKHGIRVNTVVPGQLHTPMVEVRLAGQRAGGDVEALLRDRQSRIPLGFMGDGRDTAYAALFLASDEARFVTGTEIVVDGGMTARCD